MGRLTQKQQRRVVESINRVMGYKPAHIPKTTIWQLLKEMVRPKNKKPGWLKNVNWLLDQVLKFQKSDFKK